MRNAWLPVVLWAVHFAAAYGFTALACARGIATAIPWVVGAASAAALAALAIVVLPAARRVARGGEFADTLGLGLGVLAAIAVVWEASAVVWVPGCA